MAQRRRVERRPRARLDILEQAIYLGEEASEEVALRFIDAVDAAFRRLAATPEIGRLREFRSARLAGLRSWPVPGFDKHLVFYRVGSSASCTAHATWPLHSKTVGDPLRLASGPVSHPRADPATDSASTAAPWRA